MSPARQTYRQASRQRQAEADRHREEAVAAMAQELLKPPFNPERADWGNIYDPHDHFQLLRASAEYDWGNDTCRYCGGSLKPVPGKAGFKYDHVNCWTFLSTNGSSVQSRIYLVEVRLSNERDDDIIFLQRKVKRLQ